jgi:hypothetical protein
MDAIPTTGPSASTPKASGHPPASRRKPSAVWSVSVVPTWIVNHRGSSASRSYGMSLTLIGSVENTLCATAACLRVRQFNYRQQFTKIY